MIQDYSGMNRMNPRQLPMPDTLFLLTVPIEGLQIRYKKQLAYPQQKKRKHIPIRRKKEQRPLP